MSELRMHKLRISEAFSTLIPPLSNAEYKQLEANIIHDGCREPICVWNNTIIDGHNRYKICHEHQIPFLIEEMQFVSADDVIAWICNNQIGRRNISEEMRRYLIGKRYEAEKIIGARNIFGRNQYTQKEVCSTFLSKPPKVKNIYRTAKKLGNEYHISQGTVMKYGQYAKAMDSLIQTVPEIVPKLLSGRVKMSQENVIDLSELPQREVRKFDKELGDIKTAEYVRYSDVRAGIPIKQKAEKRLPIAPDAMSIKNMPEFDPDAEITSLAYTIPSWIGALKRTHKSDALPMTSEKARERLHRELQDLCCAAEEMLAVLKEER